MNNLFSLEWAMLEREQPRPQRMRSIVRIPCAEFSARVYAQDPGFVKEVTRSFYAGDLYVLEGAYDRTFLVDLRKRVFEWGQHSSSSFHKMVEGVPDFHRIIDESVSRKYTVESIRHVYYFFPWNADPLGMFDEIYSLWRVLKVLGGFHPREYERHTPKDGIVDRVLIAHYPPGTGQIQAHADPYLYQRSIMGTKMSERGQDYVSGGLYCLDQAGEEVDVDDGLKVGDVYMVYPTVSHGVNTIDSHLSTDWNDIRGRWFLGVNSAVSDVVKDRHTAAPVGGTHPG